MRLVGIDYRDIPGGLVGRSLWYEDAASASGELSSFDAPLIMRAVPQSSVWVCGVILVNVHGDVSRAPFLDCHARRAPWTVSGEVRWLEYKSPLVSTFAVSVSVESLGGVVHARPAVHYRFRDVASVEVSPSAPLAVRARFHQRTDVPPTPMWLAPVFVLEGSL